MNKHLALLYMTALVSFSGMAGPAQADPPPWAPAHGRRVKEVREYSYVYYPAQRVYYAPETHIWFWMNGGNWQFGIHLPGQIQINMNAGGVPIILSSSRPYTEHVYVEERYGRPWRETHVQEVVITRKEKHKHGKHHDHDD